MTARNVLSRCLTLIMAMTLLAGTVAAEDLTVFVSAFAAGDQGAIDAYQLNPTSGTFKKVHSNKEVEHPFFMAISHDGKYLYSIHAPGQFGGKTDEQVAAYSVDGAKLTLLNRQSAKGSAACYVDVSAAAKAVVLANYTTGSVASYPVRPDGSLGEPASFVQHKGSGVDKSRQEGPHAHCMVVSPDGRFAFAADLGLDQVVAYRLDGAKLVPNRQPFVRTPPGAGPRHLTFHPNGRHVYVINEMQNSITVFDYEPSTGILIERQTISTLPKDFTGTSYCADVKATPDGRYLYGTNRGHDSIAAYRIGDDGQLTLLGIEPSLGKGPQNLAITPGGELLVCANMPGNNVAVFRIDAKSGSLQSVGDPVEATSPSCILIQSKAKK